MPVRVPAPALVALLATVLAALAMARPIDHDESQYVAAVVLARDGWPYRDFAYLQPPLQPLLFAPLTALFGTWTWPGLRLVNALLAAATLGFTYGSARRLGAAQASASLAALLFAACDILLFSAAMARNDALPAALFASGLFAALTPGRPRGATMLAGLLMAAAAAAKVSYAIPALAFGAWTLFDRTRRPVALVAGAVPIVLLVAFCFALAPDDFLFGVFTFPAQAPADFYAERPWKLSLAAKGLDTVKFLALGPALPALVLLLYRRVRHPAAPVLWLLVGAGLLAGVLPTPTWRQYLLPMLVPLFVLLALTIEARPLARGWRIAFVVFAVAGLAPSIEALATDRPGMPGAMAESRAIGRALDSAGQRGPVATLSPQFLPGAGRMPDRRFAAGPFYWRSRTLLAPGEEPRRHVVSARTLAAQFGPRGIWGPGAVLVGGEGAWTSGDDRLEAPLEAWAVANGWRRVPLESERFRLYLP